MEKAPLPSETRPEISPAAPNIEIDHAAGPGSVMKLCLGGKSKENVEGPGRRVDVKLQEMETHMDHLR